VRGERGLPTTFCYLRFIAPHGLSLALRLSVAQFLGSNALIFDFSLQLADLALKQKLKEQCEGHIQIALSSLHIHEVSNWKSKKKGKWRIMWAKEGNSI